MKFCASSNSRVNQECAFLAATDAFVDLAKNLEYLNCIAKFIDIQHNNNASILKPSALSTFVEGKIYSNYFCAPLIRILHGVKNEKLDFVDD